MAIKALWRGSGRLGESCARVSAGLYPLRGAAWRACLLAALGMLASALVLMPALAKADPWLGPGHVQLRQDIELLVDTGVINVPVTTWPIPWGSVSAELAKVDASRLSPAQQLACEGVVERIRAVQAGG